MNYWSIPGLKNNPSITVMKGRKVIDPNYIIKVICAYFGVHIDDIAKKSRKREVVYKRQVSMYFLKKYSLESLHTIGSRFGGRDHTTVIHSLQALNNLIDTDDTVRAEVSLLDGLILQK